MIAGLLVAALSVPTAAQMDWLKANAPHGFDIYKDGIWISAGRDATGGVYGILFDDLMARKGQSQITVWMRGDHKANKAVSFRSEKFKVTFNCATKTYQMGTTIRYWADGRVYSERQGSVYDVWQDVVPGSLAEIWTTLVCP